MKTLIATAAIFTAAAGFATPATIARWQNNLRQDAATYRAEAADCRTTAHKDRETVARRFDRMAAKADALADAMTDELADAYDAAATAEEAAHRALIEWQKANTAKAADEAEKDAASDRATAANRKAQRRLKKAQDAALRQAAKTAKTANN